MDIVFGIFLLLTSILFIFIKIRDVRLLKTVTKLNRGTRTERALVLILLKYGISAETIFHDLYLNKKHGYFAQIDLVVVTQAGIVVFEVKNYGGWIFGNGYHSKWTQILAYGKRKYYFYNPIMQNNKHIEALREKLKQFDNLPFYSIVVFYGDCVLKDVSNVPEGTSMVKSSQIVKVIKMIMSENEPTVYADKDVVVRLLKEAVQNGDNQDIQYQHIVNIKNMLDKNRIF